MIEIPDYADLLGTPFVMYGRGPKDGGLSCQGLVLEMHRRAGHAVVDPIEDEDGAEACWDVVKGPPRPMDVLGLQCGKVDLAGHVALMLDGGKVLHARRDEGVRLDWYKNISHRVLVIYRWHQPSQ